MNKAISLGRILVTVLLYILSNQYSLGQQNVGKETLAIDYFQQGNFEKALPIFAKLAQSYTDNAMYNYYYGVSLIKNNIFETAAKEALLNSVVDKTPVNSNFYLANYFHALGEWQEAMDFYDRYRKTGSKQEKKQLRFDYYVDLCNQKNNPFKPKQVENAALFGDSLMKPPPKIDEKNFPIPEALKKSTFNFQVNEFLAYHNIDDFRSEASKILFTKAWMCTGKNDSILALTDSLRKEHDRIARVDTRLGIVQQIVDCEQKSYQLMRDREKFLEQSRVKESAFWEKEDNKAAINYNASLQERERQISESKKNAEKILEAKAATVEKETAKPVVEIKPDTPADEGKPTSSSDNNLVYKVQIGAFKNGVLTTVFKQSYAKISKLRKIEKFTDERKYVFYTVGNFAESADAAKMKDQLIREGMKGSVVVSYDKTTGKPVKPEPVSTAKKESGIDVTPKTVAVPDENASKNAGVEKLIFKVQIGSFKNNLQSTVFRKALPKISKQMKVENYKGLRNMVIYTVGNLTNYQEAVVLKDQMVSEGIKDAFVAAFLDGKRIKVNEAINIAGGK